ncbi:replication protein RepA [Halopseudomonas salina]|uniref:replication protein RepA n=1 Tax=Halopseudomonas salina TaxID=1323744 RepID=UPI00123B1BBD|nr:replication protein RepA [Halopseudomonas salina]
MEQEQTSADDDETMSSGLGLSGPKLKRMDRAIDQMLAIENQTAQEAGEIGFLAKTLLQANLPHSKNSDSSWTRINGNLTFHVTSQPAVGLPYGRYPRLLLVWITTEAVRNAAKLARGQITNSEARLLSLGASLKRFMADLGLRATGGKSGSIYPFRDQMDRLFNATVTVSVTKIQGETGSVVISLGPLRVVDRFELWPKTFDSTKDSYIELSSGFYELVTSKAVPIDKRFIRHLKSSMSFDVYCWATYRVSYLSKWTEIPWSDLKSQIGAGYPDTVQGRSDFQKNFRKALHAVKLLWPQLKATPTKKGLTLKPCAPQVPRRVSEPT